jgi:hypothetical protein
MESRVGRGPGWLTLSAVVRIIGGSFALIDGLVALYRSTFFVQNAGFVFSDLNTWGWIMVGLGVAGIAAGLALFTGSEWARWIGVVVAGLSALGQLLFAQAYPLWSLMIMAIDFLVIYGLVVYGGRESVAAMSSPSRDWSPARYRRATRGGAARRSRRVAPARGRGPGETLMPSPQGRSVDCPRAGRVCCSGEAWG